MQKKPKGNNWLAYNMLASEYFRSGSKNNVIHVKVQWNFISRSIFSTATELSLEISKYEDPTIVCYFKTRKLVFEQLQWESLMLIK